MLPSMPSLPTVPRSTLVRLPPWRMGPEKMNKTLTASLRACVRLGHCTPPPIPLWNHQIPRIRLLRTRGFFQVNLDRHRRRVHARLPQELAFRGHQPTAASKRLTRIGPAIRGGDEALGHDSRHARGHAPTPVSARRSWHRNEVGASSTALTGWFGEEQFRTQLKPHGQWPYNQRSKVAVT
jgi:hypothetical protein